MSAVDEHVTNEGPPVAFTDLGVRADIVAALDARGITEPFPVQAAAIPDGLAGRDLCAKAPTGSGKTIAFGVPLVARVRRAGPKRPKALVLAPTRELAQQIEVELTPLAEARDLRVLSVYGGVGYDKQKRTLRRGVDVLVACPGRLRDLIDQHCVRLGAQHSRGGGFRLARRDRLQPRNPHAVRRHRGGRTLHARGGRQRALLLDLLHDAEMDAFQHINEPFSWIGEI